MTSFFITLRTLRYDYFSDLRIWWLLNNNSMLITTLLTLTLILSHQSLTRNQKSIYRVYHIGQLYDRRKILCRIFHPLSNYSVISSSVSSQSSTSSIIEVFLLKKIYNAAKRINASPIAPQTNGL